MATAKILLVLVTYCSIVLGQDNVKLPSMVLNHMLTGDQLPKLIDLTDSPKDRVNEPMNLMQPDQIIKMELPEITPSPAKMNTTMQPILIEQTTQLNNVIKNVTMESSEQQTTPGSPPVSEPVNLNPKPNKNITNSQISPFINTIMYIITLSTYGNNGQSSLPPLPSSTTGLLAKLLSDNLPGFPKRDNQPMITNIAHDSTTQKPLYMAQQMLNGFPTNDNQPMIINIAMDSTTPQPLPMAPVMVENSINMETEN